MPNIPPYLITLGCTAPFLLWAYLLQTARSRPLRTKGNSHHLWLGVEHYVLIAIALVMAIGFTLASVLAFCVLLGGDTEPSVWGIVIGGPFMAALGAYSFFYLTFVRLSFDDNGTARRVLRRRVFIPWSDVAGLKRHWLFGPQIVTVGGSRYGVWEYLRGFQQFVAFARTRTRVDI
jgi:hypothetical protein